MASIYGVSIKNLKTFRGHEGESLYQGDVWIGKEKQGFWSQDAWGGICDNYDFNENKLHEIAKQYKEDHLEEMSELTAKYYDADALLLDIALLMDDEKSYKRGAKQGFNTYVYTTDGFHCYGYYCFLPKGITVEDVLKTDDYKKMSKNWKFFKLREGEKLTTKVYTDISDFNITPSEKKSVSA